MAIVKLNAEYRPFLSLLPLLLQYYSTTVLQYYYVSTISLFFDTV